MADPASFLPEGRSVRCAQCGHRWFQRPPAPTGVETARAALLDMVETQTDAVEAVAPPPPAQAGAQTDMARLDALRAKAQTQLAGGSKRARRLAWAALAASLIGGAVLTDRLRVEIVRAWPQAASFYALYGREMNVRGFVFEEVAHQIIMLDGAPVIEVTGRLRNIDDRPHVAPPLRAGVANAQGVETGAWMIEPAAEPVAPGDSLAFHGRGPATADIASLELRFARRGD